MFTFLFFASVAFFAFGLVAEYSSWKAGDWSVENETVETVEPDALDEFFDNAHAILEDCRYMAEEMPKPLQLTLEVPKFVDNLENKTIRELKAIGKELKIKNYSRMRKAELLETIQLVFAWM